MQYFTVLKTFLQTLSNQPNNLWSMGTFLRPASTPSQRRWPTAMVVLCRPCPPGCSWLDQRETADTSESINSFPQEFEYKFRLVFSDSEMRSEIGSRGVVTSGTYPQKQWHPEVLGTWEASHNFCPWFFHSPVALNSSSWFLLLAISRVWAKTQAGSLFSFYRWGKRLTEVKWLNECHMTNM